VWRDTDKLIFAGRCCSSSLGRCTWKFAHLV